MDSQTLASLPPQYLAAMLRDPKLAMGLEMSKEGGDTSPVKHPLEALARAVKGVAGGYISGKQQDSYQAQGTEYNKAMANAIKSMSTGGIDAGIAASADNPMLSDFAKDLVTNKAKSDYEVNKLMAIENMKANLDPTKMRQRQAMQNIYGNQSLNNSYQGLPLPSQPTPASSGMTAGVNLPPLPSGALNQNMPMTDKVPMPPNPNQAMGAMVDAQGQPSTSFPAQNIQPSIQQPQSAPQQQPLDYTYNRDYLSMYPESKPQEGMVWQRGGDGNPVQVPDPNFNSDAKKKLDTVLRDTLASFKKLDERGGITNTDKGALENLFISATSGKMGDDYIGRTVADPQSIARMMGSENQSIRDDITGKREIIKMAVMKATGMSAKQLDSNVELQSFLKSLASPETSYQTNTGIIQGLSKQYGAGGLNNQPQQQGQVNVISPNGESGTIDASELQQALQNGWRQQ